MLTRERDTWPGEPATKVKCFWNGTRDSSNYKEKLAAARGSDFKQGDQCKSHESEV